MHGANLMAGSEDAFLERVVKGVRARERLGPEADQELMNGDMISLEEPVKAENVSKLLDGFLVLLVLYLPHLLTILLRAMPFVRLSEL